MRSVSQIFPGSSEKRTVVFVPEVLVGEGEVADEILVDEREEEEVAGFVVVAIAEEAGVKDLNVDVETREVEVEILKEDVESFDVVCARKVSEITLMRCQRREKCEAGQATKALLSSPLT